MLKPLFVSVSYHPIGQSKSRVPSYSQEGASQVALVVKNQPVNAGDTRDVGSIPGSGRSPGIGNSNPLQYCCVENPMDRGAWWATVHRIAKSQTWLKRLSMWSRQGKVGRNAKFLDKGHRHREGQTQELMTQYMALARFYQLVAWPPGTLCWEGFQSFNWAHWTIGHD